MLDGTETMLGFLRRHAIMFQHSLQSLLFRKGRQGVGDATSATAGQARLIGYRTAVGQLSLAYLINQYPKTSHSFIRREIAALESRGVRVVRWAIRATREDLVDEDDVRERDITRTVLGVGVGVVLGSVFRTIVAHPVCSMRAFLSALGLGAKSSRGMVRHVAYFAEACVIRLWASKEAIDHVHIHFATNAVTVILLTKMLGGPSYSFTVHGSAELDDLLHLAMDRKLGSASFAAAASSYVRAQLYRFVRPEYWEKIHVIGCGVDDDFLTMDRCCITDSQQLICVARMSPEKGHFPLLEAARILASEGQTFRLALIGDGALMDAIKERVERYELTQYVDILGWCSNQEIRQRLLASRALVVPSFMEGLPVVIMEAFALRRPVVATYVGGIPELVRHGDNGWLATAGDVDALAQAMRNVLKASPARLNQMGESGFADVQKKHVVRNEADKLLALFCEQVRQDNRGLGSI